MAPNKIENVRRRVNRARASTPFMCAGERHLHIMADCLSTGKRVYPMLQEDPEYCAESIYSVLESLWKLRAKEKRA